jgi:type IV secretory pathway TraG/TraD family ATPase VirD4
MKWGRNESVIWPPHGPINTWGAIFLSFVFAGLFLYLRFAFGLVPLQQFYLPYYLRCQTLGLMHKVDKYQLVMLMNNDGTHSRLATSQDVASGSTAQYTGKLLPLKISNQAIANGYVFLGRQPKTSYSNSSLLAYLQGSIYDGQNLWDIFKMPLFLGVLSLLIQLPFSIARDVKRRKQLRYGRRLRGPERLDPKEFNQKVKGDGLGIKTDDMKEMLRIPAKAEAQHIQVIGDTGAGKSTIIMQFLRQIQSRGESAIIYDPALEYTRRFLDLKRGDVVLNPLDKRCPYWGPAEELLRNSEADAIAASLFQPAQDKKGEFFTEIPQQIFAHLLRYGPTPTELIEWMSNPAEIDRRVAGTENANYIDRSAGPQRVGVLASLSKVAKSLRLLPTIEHTNGAEWSATSWAETRQGWVFITSLPAEREALRPLQSVWIDMLVLRLLNEPKPGQKRVWFVLDELASLQRLPQLATALTENRKSNNPIILGFQGKAQLEVIYGHMAEVMLSQPSTSIYLKTKEPKAGKWISEAIGTIEIERMKETHFNGSRSGANFSLDRQVEPVVLESEISGLPDLTAFLKHGNYVTGFSFPYLDVMPMNVNGFEPRELENVPLTYDPNSDQRSQRAGRRAPASTAPATSEAPSPFEDTEKPLEPSAPVGRTPARTRTKDRERTTENVGDSPELPLVSNSEQEEPPAVAVIG